MTLKRLMAVIVFGVFVSVLVIMSQLIRTAEPRLVLEAHLSGVVLSDTNCDVVWDNVRGQEQLASRKAKQLAIYYRKEAVKNGCPEPK